jgi:cytochrome c biogenesis protein CcdA
MILLFVSFIAGVLTVLAPCVLPILPVIIGGSVSESRSRSKPFVITASLAISVVLFTLILKASTVFIMIPPEVWRYISGGILLVFAFTLIFPGLWENVTAPFKLSQKSNKIFALGFKKKNLMGDIIMGASLGPVFSSCSPTYFVILATVLPVSFFLGTIYLIAYALGLGLVLLLVSLLGQRFVEKIGFATDPNGSFKKIIGVVFFLVAVFVITGADKKVQTYILDQGFFDITSVEQILLKKTE